MESFRYNAYNYANRMFVAYVCEDALTQINIRADQRETIKHAVAVPDFSVALFDVAQREIFNVMQNNSYVQFLNSKFVVSYLQKKIAKYGDATIYVAPSLRTAMKKASPGKDDASRQQITDLSGHSREFDLKHSNATKAPTSKWKIFG